MPIDIILVLVIIAGFWLGYTKGIVATLFSVLEYVVAILLTLGLSPFLARFLTTSLNMDRMVALLLSTIVFFFVFIFLIKWLTKKIEASLKKGKLSSSTKVLGGIVMMLACVFMYSILLWLVNYYGLVNEKMKLASYTYKPLEAIPAASRTLVLDLKPVFQRYWELIQESVGDPKTPTSG
ncbi:MAG TPA: CvpA family protein [Saprospiraceae bacterium]|nr:CvpA family protein [Saprospiraceae bacterium]